MTPKELKANRIKLRETAFKAAQRRAADEFKCAEREREMHIAYLTRANLAVQNALHGDKWPATYSQCASDARWAVVMKPLLQRIK